MPHSWVHAILVLVVAVQVWGKYMSTWTIEGRVIQGQNGNL